MKITLEYFADGIAILFALYLVVRLCAAAYFMSKSDYERKQKNGTIKTRDNTGR